MRVVREILGFEPTHTGTDLRLLLETLSKSAGGVAFVISDYARG
jgi:hypothetical protein